MIKENKMIHYTAKNGEEIQFPFYLIEGKEAGPKVCITAGVHGAEYNSIIAAIRLYKNLNPIEVKGQIKIIPIVNLPGYKNITMHNCPIDNKNLNFIFPGSENGSYSEQLVFKLFNDFIKGSNYYLDLHGGDLTEEIVPWCFVHKSGNKVVDQRSIELAENYGTDIVFTSLEGSWPDRGTIYSYASENGIPAIMPEQGGVGQIVEQDVLGHLNGLYNVLKFVGCLKGNPTPPKNKINYFSNSPALFLKSEGIFYPRCKPGDQVNEGDELGILEDYLGNKIEVVKAPYSGKIIMLNTSLAVNEKEELLVIAY